MAWWAAVRIQCYCFMKTSSSSDKPAFVLCSDSPLDLKIKSNMISDLFSLTGKFGGIAIVHKAEKPPILQ